VGKIHVPYKGSAGVEFPGKIQMSHSWPCTFIESSDSKVFNALHNWLEKILSVKSGHGSFDSDIKTDIYLRLLAQDNSVSRSIKMVGCFLSTMDDQALTYDNENAIMYNATFSYDYWEPSK
jgi:hypothetical protein